MEFQETPVRHGKIHSQSHLVVSENHTTEIYTAISLKNSTFQLTDLFPLKPTTQST